MKLSNRARAFRFILGSMLLGLTLPVSASATKSHDGAISETELGGAVTSAKDPEAGVWVIAETDDLPTKFAKIVVTDDHGRYLIPDLPKANYRVFVRGYGLLRTRPRHKPPPARR